MKNYIAVLIFLAVSIVAVPAIPVYFSGKATSDTKTNKHSEITNTNSSTELKEFVFDEDTQSVSSYVGEPYKVLDVSTGTVIEVCERDYVIGAVCAEMPASFETEALKAQAVAAHTYAERQRLRERQNPTAELCGADFSNDTSKYQGYFTENQAKQFFGDNYEMNYSKICNVVDEVLPYVLTYGDEPIISAFHSMSTGKTESAENAWGTAVDYLVPVDSSFDTSAPRYLDEVRYNKDVLKNKLETAFPSIVLGEDITTWIGASNTSESGTVLSIAVGNISVSGNDIRIALALRSACFEVRYENDEAVFTTRGYGHGVGMSQYGANSMASAGKSWREILEHYYIGCEIKEF